MRCKPDDLARIIDSELDPLAPWMLKYKGLTVVVLKLSDDYQGCWLTSLRQDADGKEIHIYDHHLEPIRPTQEPVMVGQLTDITERV